MALTGQNKKHGNDTADINAIIKKLWREAIIESHQKRYRQIFRFWVSSKKTRL